MNIIVIIMFLLVFLCFNNKKKKFISKFSNLNDKVNKNLDLKFKVYWINLKRSPKRKKKMIGARQNY